MLFHEKLIQRRKERGMTQEELADRLSVSRQTVSKWENGECMPEADKFIRLSDILEISLDELAGREVEVEPIVLPAPELPQPGKKLRRFLAAAAVCLTFGAGGVAFGRFVIPKQTSISTTEHAPALPDTLTVSNMIWDSTAYDKGVGFSFTSNVNASSEAVVYLYEPWKTEETTKIETSYENGMYHVFIPYGVFDKAVFVVREGDQERSVLLTEYLYVDMKYNEYHEKCCNVHCLQSDGSALDFDIYINDSADVAGNDVS